MNMVDIRRVVVGPRIGKMSLPERLTFFSRKEDDCIIWTGNIASTGYGRMTIRGRRHFAHRDALVCGKFQDVLDALMLGVSPPEFPYRKHRTDNPKRVYSDEVPF